MAQHGALNGNGIEADLLRDPAYKDLMAAAAKIEKDHSNGFTYGQAYDEALIATADLMRLEQKQAVMKENPIQAWNGASINRILDRITVGKSNPAMLDQIMSANAKLGKNPNDLKLGDTLHIESLPVTNKGFAIYMAMVAAQHGPNPLDGDKMQALVDYVAKAYDAQDHQVPATSSTEPGL